MPTASLVLHWKTWKMNRKKSLLKMLLPDRFINYIHAENLFQKHDHLLLAVSGGIDSVVLCHLCYSAGFDFEIAHCNFQLRGEESERDEKFLRDLSERYGVKLFVKKFETKQFAEQNKMSIQVAARTLRYSWFDSLLEQRKNSSPVKSYLVTAHHANDNIETLLMNFFKGSGISGLHGMFPKTGRIVRPLLFAKRSEILLYLEENHLAYVEDSSNLSDKYTRNFFRHEIIPSLQKVFPKVEENLIHNVGRFKEIEMLYHQAVDAAVKKLIEKKGNEIHIPVLKLLKTQPLHTLVYEIIKDFSFTSRQTADVIGLLSSDSGKYVSSSTHKIIKNRNWLIISPINTVQANHILIEENEEMVHFEAGALRVKKYPNNGATPATNENVATLDAKGVVFPLLLRKWKQGDYFYPLGMKKKKKKVSKFFIDQKLSITEKENIWIVESNKKILWILGKRIDERFKISAATREILELSFTPKKK